MSETRPTFFERVKHAFGWRSPAELENLALLEDALGQLDSDQLAHVERDLEQLKRRALRD